SGTVVLHEAPGASVGIARLSGGASTTFVAGQATSIVAASLGAQPWAVTVTVATTDAPGAALAGAETWTARSSSAETATTGPARVETLVPCMRRSKLLASVPLLRG